MHYVNINYTYKFNEISEYCFFNNDVYRYTYVTVYRFKKMMYMNFEEFEIRAAAGMIIVSMIALYYLHMYCFNFAFAGAVMLLLFLYVLIFN